MTLDAREQQRSEVVSRWLAGIITPAEAVALLGCSERTAWRLRAAVLREGAAGLAHRNRGRASPRRLPDDVADRIVLLATTEYRGLSDTHLAEKLCEGEGIAVSRRAHPARPPAGPCGQRLSGARAARCGRIRTRPCAVGRPSGPGVHKRLGGGGRACRGRTARPRAARQRGQRRGGGAALVADGKAAGPGANGQSRSRSPARAAARRERPEDPVRGGVWQRAIPSYP